MFVNRLIFVININETQNIARFHVHNVSSFWLIKKGALLRRYKRKDEN